MFRQETRKGGQKCVTWSWSFFFVRNRYLLWWQMFVHATDARDFTDLQEPGSMTCISVLSPPYSDRIAAPAATRRVRKREVYLATCVYMYPNLDCVALRIEPPEEDQSIAHNMHIHKWSMYPKQWISQARRLLHGLPKYLLHTKTLVFWTGRPMSKSFLFSCIFFGGGGGVSTSCYRHWLIMSSKAPLNASRSVISIQHSLLLVFATLVLLVNRQTKPIFSTPVATCMTS